MQGVENSMLTSREACDRMAELTHSEAVQVIGTRFVLYKKTLKSTELFWINDENRNFGGTFNPPHRGHINSAKQTQCQ